MRTTYGLMALVAVMMAATGAASAQDAPYCREYQQKVTIGGQVHQTYGTACQQPDGSWQLAQPEDVAAPVQMAAAAPIVVQQQPVVYQQPVYVQDPVIVPSVGLSFGFNDWHGGGGGWRGGPDWHGGGWHR